MATTAASSTSLESAPIQDSSQPDLHHFKDPIKQAQIRQELTTYLTLHDFQVKMKRPFRPIPYTHRQRTTSNRCFISSTIRSIQPIASTKTWIWTILSKMRYPYKNTICKAHLVAVDSKHGPSFLALLYWIMQLGQDREQRRPGSAHGDARMEGGDDVRTDVAFDGKTTT